MRSLDGGGGITKASLAFSLLGSLLLGAPWPDLVQAQRPLPPDRHGPTTHSTALRPASTTATPTAGQILEVPYYDLQCNGLVSFDDIPGGFHPGTIYTVPFESDGALFAEHFAGQTVDGYGSFDVVSGEPRGPLQLRAGTQNLQVCYVNHSQDVSGLGPNGARNQGGGAVACLFDFDQSEVGFVVWYGNGGSGAVSFYRRNGTPIETVPITNLGDPSVYGFRRADGSHDIAGILIQNTDLGGVTYDNICHDVGGVPGRPPICIPGGPYRGGVNDSIRFDARQSYDADGSIDSYHWDFGDGAEATAAAPTHAYASAGSYQVTVCVVDNAGLENCCGTTAAIDDLTPTLKSSWGQIKRRYR